LQPASQQICDAAEFGGLLRLNSLFVCNRRRINWLRVWLRATLDLTHRQMFRDCFIGEREQGGFVSYGEQRSGVPERELTGFEELADVKRKVQEAKGVGDRRPIFADCLSDLLLGEAKIVEEASVAFGFFYWVEDGALEVLDQGEREEGSIVDVADKRWDV
jgi:hypothetical protein